MAASHALALAEPRAKGPALYGTRAQLAAGEGEIEGYLALAGCDKRAGTANYVLRIVNQSAQRLRARMTCAQMRGEAILAYPLDVHVAPYSISETLLPVRVADVGPFDRAIVQIAGGDVAFSLEAPAPPRSQSRSRWIAFSAGALALTVGAGVCAAMTTPRIALLAAPQRIAAKAPLEIPYAFGGFGSMRYALETRDGRQLSAGLVERHEGTLHFIMPPNAGRDVVLNVSVIGPFGTRSAAKEIAIAAQPHRATAPQKLPLSAPRISEFTLVTTIARANHDVRFAYATNAATGEIWLIDAAGRLWARGVIDPTGSTIIRLPEATAGRQMRAVLHARSGKLDDVASIGFTVLPDATISDAATPSTTASATQSSQAALTLSTQHPSPGETFTVAIDRAHGDTQVTLNDGSGTAVEQGDIPAGQSAVALTAPSVSKPTTYYVMASVTQGISQQTLVQKLTVTPH
jgi:hypothetical protein